MYVIGHSQSLKKTYQSSWWLLFLHGVHFQIQKDKGQEKDCLSKYSFIYCTCQPFPELPIPQPPTTHAIFSISLKNDDSDLEVDTQCSSKDPYFPNQNELDDLTRDLGLTKAKAIILSSRLMEFVCSFVQDFQAKKTTCDRCKFLCNVLWFWSSFTLLLYWYTRLVSRDWYCLINFGLAFIHWQF